MRIRLSLAALVAALASVCPARATVTTSAASTTCVAPGGAMTCNLTFPFFNNSDLVVTLNGVAQTITSQYTVACAGCSSGGSVTMVSNPTAGATLLVTRSMPLTQLFDPRLGPYRPASYGVAFDTLEMQIQQLASGIEGLGFTGFSTGGSTPGGTLSVFRGGTGSTSMPICSAGQALSHTGSSTYACVSAGGGGSSSHVYFTNTILNAVSNLGVIPPTSTLTPIASLSLPAGNYMVIATAWADVNGQVGTVSLNPCSLSSVGFGGTLVANTFRIVNFGVPIVLSYTYNTAISDTLTFSCRDTGGTEVDIVHVSLSAYAADALN